MAACIISLMLPLQFCRSSLSMRNIHNLWKLSIQMTRVGTKLSSCNQISKVDNCRTNSVRTDWATIFVDGASCEFGYLFPGHGLKGKQRVIENDEDVAMYGDYKGKRIITLWIVFLEATFISKETISFPRQAIFRQIKKENTKHSYVSSGITW